MPGPSPGDAPRSDRSCSVCHRTFTKPAHLQRHVRTHVSEKPFACEHCSKPFARTDALHRHIRTVHNKRPRNESDASTFLAPNAFLTDSGVSVSASSEPASRTSWTTDFSPPEEAGDADASKFSASNLNTLSMIETGLINVLGNGCHPGGIMDATKGGWTFRLLNCPISAHDSSQDLTTSTTSSKILSLCLTISPIIPSNSNSGCRRA